ncbi:MAG: T9SS type A sorting domain-containing protein [Bacteroidales bacterium]|nr:T9SS type A sorting domain-containing protein [Bacteroidales bacterium]
MAVHAVGFPCASGQEGLGDQTNLQYEIASHITTLVVNPDRQIVGQFYGPDYYPSVDTLNNFLLSIGAEMLDCTVGIQDENLNYHAASKIQISPNPVVEDAEMIINTEMEGSFEMSIYNNMGISLLSEAIYLNKNENRIPINISNFNSGIYYIKIQNSQGVTSLGKFIKK